MATGTPQGAGTTNNDGGVVMLGGNVPGSGPITDVVNFNEATVQHKDKVASVQISGGTSSNAALINPSITADQPNAVIAQHTTALGQNTEVSMTELQFMERTNTPEERLSKDNQFVTRKAEAVRAGHWHEYSGVWITDPQSGTEQYGFDTSYPSGSDLYSNKAGDVVFGSPTGTYRLDYAKKT